MKDDEFRQSGDVREESNFRQNKQLAQQEKENFGEHLARVIEDADHCKDLLVAHYKARHEALHSTPPASNSARQSVSRDTKE